MLFPKDEPASELWSGIEQHGSLSLWLDALWEEMESPLRCRERKTPSKTSAHLRYGSCAVGFPGFKVREEEIKFSLREDGVVLGYFAIDTAEKAAQIFHELFVVGKNILELEPQFSKFHLEEHTLAFLEGPKAYTDYQWRKLDDWFSSDQHFKILYPVLTAARAHPQLGQLYPFQSMFSFYLSRCTGYPFDTACSGIQPTSENGFYQENGIYAVTNKYKQTGIEFEGSVEDAINFFAVQLPPDCGAARQGTVEDA